MSGGLFEEKPFGAELESFFNVSVVAVSGKNEDFGRGAVFEDLSSGFQTIQEGHRDIHHDHGGTELSSHFHGLASRFRLSHDLQVSLALQQFAQPLPDDHV